MRRYVASLGIAALLTASAVRADGMFGDQGKLLLTAGFSTLEGAGGGALAPWALITGYGSSDSYGANAHYTDVELNSARLQSYGAAIGILDRVEISASRLNFSLTDALGSFHIGENVFGAKLRLFGDAVYAQDSWIPQVALGAEYKKNDDISDALGISRPEQLGARNSDGVDVYLSATKVYLAQSLLLNATVRATRANQLGLLGFGGDLKSADSVEFEASAAYLLLRQLAVGAEYRSRPHNLGVDEERGAWDAFVAWAPGRHVSLIAGYADVGSILKPATGDTTDHAGSYVSVQIGF